MTPMERTRRRSRRLQLKKSLLKEIPTHQKSATVRFPELQNNSSEANSDGSKPVTAYTPAPLQDPKSQIRLLKFVSAVGQSPLALETSVWNLDEAPPYVAISYTWGGHNERTVVINGEPARIRYNAYYALRQVQLHHRRIHIWMDSICINQSDDVEKSAQVAMMYQMFKGATRVVASLGAHSHDTEWLFVVARRWDPVLRRRRGKYELRKALNRASNLPPFDVFGRRLSAAVHDLDKHAYWRRLWVVQEVAAARTDIGLLRGPHQVSAITMRSIIDETASYRVYRRKSWRYQGDVCRLLEIVGSARRDRQTFTQNLYQFSGFHCSDPRDRIFALVGITDWQESGRSRIIPDYSKSAWDLAREIGSALPLAVLKLLVRALEITPDTEEVAGLLRSGDSMQTMQGTELDADRDSPTVSGQHFKQNVCFRLRADASGGLCADIDLELYQSLMRFYLPSQAESYIRGKGDSPHQIARPVCGMGGKVAALVCSGARPDDILVPVEVFGNLLVIVRASKTNDMHYDVIGQGLLIKGTGFDITTATQSAMRGSFPSGPCSCSPEFLARQSMFMADMHIALTIEELIVLGAQVPWNPAMSEESCIAAALDRMATNLTARPRSAVSFTNFSCSCAWWRKKIVSNLSWDNEDVWDSLSRW